MIFTKTIKIRKCIPLYLQYIHLRLKQPHIGAQQPSWLLCNRAHFCKQPANNNLSFRLVTSYSSSTLIVLKLDNWFPRGNGLTLKSLIIGWSGLISKILLPLMNSKLDVSPSVCAFMSLSDFEKYICMRKQIMTKQSNGLTTNLPFHIGGPTELARYKNTWRWT